MRNGLLNYRRHLIKMPFLSKGVMAPERAPIIYVKLKSLFETSGFQVVACDHNLKRFVVSRNEKYENSNWLYIVWVRNVGNKSYISFGLEPRISILFICGRRNHLNELNSVFEMIASVIDSE